MVKDNLIRMYQESFRNNSELPALTDYFKKTTLTYFDLAQLVAKNHLVFEKYGIKAGEKIALIGRNTPMWVSVYASVITYGAVIVPILQDFNPIDATNIINHSDSRILFLSSDVWAKMDTTKFTQLEAVIDYETMEPLWERTADTMVPLYKNLDTLFAERYPKGFTTNDIVYPEVTNDKVCIISYTSGTTGFSKGVMLTVNNVTANVAFAILYKFHYRGSRVLGILPLAHAFGCAFDMLTPLATGSHITLLGKLPAAPILLKALKDVKPDLLLTVPLLVEKIIKGKVMPTLNKQPIKTLVKIPLLNQIVYKKVRTQLMDAFGGALTELIMGGAALNSDVEKLLKKINLPYTVGYGMTETAPLICYAHHTEYKSLSCGKLVPGMEMKIDSTDPYNIPGEICVRGENVTVGYYKNQEATDAALDADGWFHTGDMGVVDKATNCFIRGRCKTMLLSNNGQNIYPEEIEAKLNNLEAVVESLVVQEDGGKLTALVVPDYAKAKENGWDNAKLQEVMNENLVALNKLVAPYERVANIKMCEGEFEKTPKKSIKRFLYPAAAKIVS
ncbi:MAG: long-chain fatty acid--CoA ligase [Rikenellaceae bacterium]|nr:long-chain fatty acid--CoA ligase [Rikenellaceae bacterium]